jgi:hypothetical protein
LAAALKNNHTLTTLHVECEYEMRTIIGWNKLCAGDCVTDSMRCLLFFVADNRIGDDGASALAAALQANRTLTELYLGGAY